MNTQNSTFSPALAESTLSGALGGVLTDFLNARGLQAVECRKRLARWKPDGRISVLEWSTCLYLISQEDDRPELGLEIARHFQPEHAGLMAYLALSCRNIGELMEQLDRLHHLMWQGFHVSLQWSLEGIFTVSWATYTPPSTDVLDVVRLAYETGIAGIVHFFRVLCGDAHTPCAVTLMGAPPQKIEPYEAFFRCPVTFSPHTSSLSFTREILALPISAKETVLRQLVERQAAAQIRALDSNDTFMLAFRQALSRAISVGKPTIEYVAADLSTSRITVQRRLKAYGTGFQEILDKTRFEMARLYIENPRLSLAEIALLLAFSEQSAFCRAFRRWSGISPQQFRQHLEPKSSNRHEMLVAPP